MRTNRIVALVVLGGAVVVWLAAAATSGVRPSDNVVARPPAAIDLKGAALAAEITRLHERLRPSATPVQSRDLFRYSAKRSSSSPRPVVSAPLNEPTPIDPPTLPSLKLVGIAEDDGVDGPVRTAIISDAGALVFVKEGEMVSLRYRASRISSDVVELTDTIGGAVVRLALK
jgi:hypothetical protein